MPGLEPGICQGLRDATQMVGDVPGLDGATCAFAVASGSAAHPGRHLFSAL